MDADKRELLVALAWMSEQHLATPNGLEHMCMSAGERAVEVLFKYGLVDSPQRFARWTEAGENILKHS